MSSDSARDAATADEPEVGDEAGNEAGAPVDTDGTVDSGDAGDTDADDDFGGTADEADAEPVAGDGDGAEAGDGDVDEAAQAGTKSTRHDLLPRRLLLGSGALALAAFIVAAVFGVMWLITASGDKAELASSRDSVVDSAGEAVQAVTELDYQNPDRFFQRSEAVSTKEFGKQLTKAEKELRKALEQAKTKVQTDVHDVAVQELNAHDGTATFLAVASTHITQGDRNATKVLRLKGQMKRVSTDGSKEWKLAGLSEVPVVGSGAKGAQQESGQGSGPGK